MAITDAFTAKPAKRAAAENRTLYQNNLAAGLGYLDTGKIEGIGYLSDAGHAFDPLWDLSRKYGAGTSMYLDAMGVNGPEGIARAQQAFQTGPGYDFAFNEGQRAVNRAQLSYAPDLRTGGAAKANIAYGTGMANQEYGNWLKNFQNFINPEITTAGAAATGQSTALTNQAQLTASDAAQRVNLGNTTTSGLANVNNNEANAQMQASGNLLGFGLNLAKLATGLPMFGGAGANMSRNAG